MTEEGSAWEIVSGKIEKIRLALADYPQLQAQIFPCLDEIGQVVQIALPCPVLPEISLKDYSEQLPDAAALRAAVIAAGPYCEFHGYTFWQSGDHCWTLTNPYGRDDIMTLRCLEDFEDFLTQLHLGNVIDGPA